MSAQPPRPNLAWQFESSNVDSVSGLAPYFSTVNGSITSAPTYVTGKYGQAIQFNNTGVASVSNSYVRYNVSIPIASFSICAWINPYQLLGTTQGQIAISVFDGSANYFNLFGVNSNQNSIYLFGQNPYTPQPVNITINGSGTIPTNTWSHWAATFNNGNISFYFNGALQGTATFANTFTVTQIFAGAYWNTANGFNGSIDDLRVFNKVLTTAQVQTIYAAGGMPNQMSLSVVSAGATSLVVTSPQPNLAWQFESSNVDSVTGLAPNGGTFTPTALQFAPTYITGIYRQAINFNNTLLASGTAANSYVTYDVSSLGFSSNSGAISLWLNSGLSFPIAAGQNPYYVSFTGTTYYSFQTEQSTSSISFHTGSSPSVAILNPGQTGVWNHYCAVFSNVGTTGASNTASYFYFNGSLIGSGNTLSQSFTSLSLGSASGLVNGALCSIDDLRLFKTALSATQVQSIYNAQGMPNQINLI